MEGVYNLGTNVPENNTNTMIDPSLIELPDETLALANTLNATSRESPQAGGPAKLCPDF